MNTLAHFYLSGDDINLQIGNFIADTIRGKQIEDYSPEVQQGIIMHRAIDSFTDTHPIVSQSKKRLFEKYRHYSAVIIDVIYDHFLAKDFDKYHTLDLNTYSKQIYKNLKPHVHTFPLRGQNQYEFMSRNNGLKRLDQLSYAGEILTYMSQKRVSFESKMEQAEQDILKDYDLYGTEFTAFFEELIHFCDEHKRKLS
ncbi:MAG: DUF479 domain-containing protein [Cytophagales bacterium]|nr:DUF479 domain-containing protein [Cytophagales bacterium]